MAIAGSLEIQLFANLARIRQDMDQARQIVGSTMRGIEQAVGIAKQALATLGLSFGVAGIVSMIDQYSKYNAQLKLATANERELAAARSEVRRITTLAQTDLGATGVLYARITNSTRELGTSQRQVAVLTEVISLALKVSGATAQETSSAMLQLSQSFASGKFRGEEFNAVNEAAPRLMKALADGMGVPIGALREMAFSGLLTAEVMAKALPHALTELRQEALTVQTIGGAFIVLKNAVMEFVGAQAIGNNGVATISTALTSLARNLDVVVSVIGGITASKLAGWLITVSQAFYAKGAAAIASVQASGAERVANIAVLQSEVARTVGTLEFVVAERSRIATELAATQATIAATAAIGAQAMALRMNTEAHAAHGVAVNTLAQLGRLQATAQAEQVAAQTALNVAIAGGGTAATLATRALGLLGGPIGLIATALGLGVTAWALWGRSSEDANKKAVTSTIASTNEILDNLDKQIVKLRERLDLAKKFGEVGQKESPEGDRAAGLYAQIGALMEKQAAAATRGSRLDRNDQYKLDQAKQDLAEMVFKMGQVAKIKEEIEDVARVPKLAEWMAKYANDTEKMAAEIAKAKKELGGNLPEDLENRIRERFAKQKLSTGGTDPFQNEMVTLQREFAAMAHVGELEAYAAKLQESAYRDLTKAQRDNLITQKEINLSKKYEIETRKLLLESNAAALMAEQAVMDLNADYTIALRETLQALSFENSLIGKNADEIGRANLARQLELQLKQAIASLPEGSGAAADDLRRKAEITKASAMGLLLEKQVLSEQQNRWNNLASSAANYFGTVGASAGKLIKTLVDLGDKQVEIERKRAEAAKLNDPEKRAKLEDDLARSSAAVKLGAYGDMTQAAAGFFGEQSKGYAVLMRVSQVFHAAELALTLAELVPKAINAILTQGTGDPYTAFARMATMAAIVAGLGVAVSGGSGANTSSVDRQKSQGTGSVLGDAGAKSESFTKALDLLSKNSVIGNEHTSQMVRSLLAIENNIEGLGALVVRSAGLTGADTSGMGLGKTARFSLPSWLDPLGIIAGLFGSTKKELTDSGLQINRQTFGAARQGISANSYADIQTTSSYLFGLVKRTSNSTVTDTLSSEITDQFTLILKNIYNGILEAAKVFGSDIGSIGAILDAFQIDFAQISFKDMSGDEIEKALEGIFSKIGDNLAGAAFPELTHFQKVGEGLFETLARLAQEFAATDEIARILGKDVSTAFGAVGFAAIAARDDLVQLFGGIEKMSDGVSKYYELFYSEAERTDRAFDLLQGQFDDLNMAMPATNEEFRALVEAQDLSTEAGRNMFAFLIQVAPAFDSISQAAKAMADDIYSAALTIGGGLSSAGRQAAINNAATAWNDFYNNFAGTSISNAETIANAIMASNQAAAGDRSLLDSMIGGAFAIGGQQGAQLLQNLFNAIAANTSATSGNTGSVDSAAGEYARMAQALADERATLSAYLRGSLLSDNSPLDPMAKYRESQAQYQSMLGLAQGGNLDAMAGLGGARDQFLQFSRLVNASNGQYNTDFFGSYNDVAGLTGGAIRPYTAADATANTAAIIASNEKIAQKSDVIVQAVSAMANAVIENAINNTAETKAVLVESANALNKIAASGGSLVSSGI